MMILTDEFAHHVILRTNRARYAKVLDLVDEENVSGVRSVRSSL